MSRLTYKQIVAAIQRTPNLALVSLGEIKAAVEMASKDLGNQPWPWNYAETNVLVPAAYSTGTINVTDGTMAVTGVGTAWDNSWVGYRIQFSNNNIDYIVQAVTGLGALTLAQPVNLGYNIVNGSYNLYKDTYEYPADYLVGSDVGLFQTQIQTRIPKIPRYTFESFMNQGLRSFSTNIQMFYCDQGLDFSGAPFGPALYRFRLGPPPSGPAELRLVYHSIAPDVDLNYNTPLPEGFDEVIQLTATSKLYDMKKMPGDSQQAKDLAIGKIKLLKRQVATQTIDDVPQAAFEMSDSSISQWGMTISRMP